MKKRLAFVLAPALWMSLGAVLVWTGRASSQVGCAETLPAPLIAFCPGTPARASDMNANFRAVAAWIESKVGPVGSGDVTITGAVSVPAGSFTGTELADGSVSGDDVTDGSVALADLDPGVVGTGLRTSGSSIAIDQAWLRNQIRAQLVVSSEYVLSFRPTDSGSSRDVDMGVPTTNSFCALEETRVFDDNDEDDTTYCQVYEGSGTWHVTGWSNADDGGTVVCRARCVHW